MKQTLFFSLSLAAFAAMATANPITVNCTPNAGSASSTKGNSLVVNNGNGTGSFSCAAIPVQTNNIINFAVYGTATFQGSSTQPAFVTWTDTVDSLGVYGGGPVTEAFGSANAQSGPTTYTPAEPFIIGNGSSGVNSGSVGADLGVTSLGSFTVSVSSGSPDPRLRSRPARCTTPTMSLARRRRLLSPLHPGWLASGWLVWGSSPGGGSSRAPWRGGTRRSGTAGTAKRGRPFWKTMENHAIPNSGIGGSPLAVPFSDREMPRWGDGGKSESSGVRLWGWVWGGSGYREFLRLVR